MNNEKFGKFISEARKEKNLTQKELAKQLNVTDKAVSKWERGKSYPDISLLEPLGKALDVSVIELLKSKKTDKKENETLILNAINLYKKEFKKKTRKLLIYITAFFLFVLALIFIIWKINQPKYSKDHAFTQFYIPYTSTIKGELDVMKYINLSPDFAIGANQYGYAVFINPDRAFQRLVKDYQKGIQLIKKEFKLPKLNKNNFTKYEIYGAQVTMGSEEEKKEARLVSSILDIYENSFDINTLDKMIFN